MQYVRDLVDKKVEISADKKRICFPEGDDLRVQEAAKKIVIENLPILPVLLVSKPVSIDGVETIDKSEFLDEELIKLFVEKRNGKCDTDTARELIQKTNYYGTLLLEAGRVDGLVGGCVYATGEILLPAFQIVKTKPGFKTVSSSFLMLKGDLALCFGDCAVNIDPTVEQLADIAKATADTAEFLNIENRKIAMLSFSTKGSAKHEFCHKVADATALAKSQITNAEVDGELQFDAAFVESVGAQKAPGSSVAGHANIFIFPDLQSGNIGYKIAQRLGGFEAVGPILQGLNKPIADLSRGASAYDIFLTAQIVYLQI
jgi:phosphate acetyltransferase